MATKSPRPRVAVACQGGGSHTAFTAGVLKRLVRDDRFDVVALSGTSGGAVCAFLTWFALSKGEPDRAGELLDAFWEGIAATDPWDAALNSLMVATSRLEGTVVLPSVSPYRYPPFAADRMRDQVERLVSRDEVAEAQVPAGPAGVAPGPLLLVGAVDVRTGEFKAFSSARGEISTDAILASAAIPNLFRAVQVDGGVYWDGLFSQNPPVRELPRAKPDAIWVVRINPSGRGTEPRSMPDIVDRRNELSGNLSLSQELFFIDKINELVRDGDLSGTRYQKIAIDSIALDRDLDMSSKLDRSPGLIAELMALGEEQANAFLARQVA